MKDGPYATIIIGKILDAPGQYANFLLSLELSYMLSLQIRFVFPIATRMLKLVDAAFDRVLNNYSIVRKSILSSSKGILYARDISVYEREKLMEGATFVLTTDARIGQTLLAKGFPHVFISGEDEMTQIVRPRCLESIEDENLRQSLVECIRHHTINTNCSTVGI